MIAAHNAFDGISSEQLGSVGWIWKILHEGFKPVAPSRRYHGVCDLSADSVDWRHVGRLLLRPRLRSARGRAARFLTLQLGLALTAAFVVLRLSERLWRSERVVTPAVEPYDGAVFSARVEISAVVALSPDDAGPCAHCAERAGAHDGRQSQSATGVRTGAALLLRRALVSCCT